MINDLGLVSDSELIKLYRIETDSNRDRIIRYLLFDKEVKGKTWNQKIWVCVNFNIGKLTIDCSCDKDDLYQEAIQAFHKTLDKWFDIDSGYGLATYVYPAINSAINRVFQKFSKTKKRKLIELGTEIEINQMHEHSRRKMHEVITEQDFGKLRTLTKGQDYSKVIFYRDIIKHLKTTLVHENIDADENLIMDLTKYIKERKNNKQIFYELSMKHGKTINYIKNVRTMIIRNIEKSMFKDLIVFFEYDIKNKECLAKKYNCSKTQVSKHIELMKKNFKKHLLNINLQCKEIFN